MSNKYKYTFFLNNTSKIVITDESDNIDMITHKLKRILESKKFSVFQTNTDMVIINPLKIDAIHISSIGDTLKDDKFNSDEEITLEDNINIVNNKEYVEETDTEIDTDSNLTNNIDWTENDIDDDFSDIDIDSELNLKTIDEEI